ncbi:MAG: hypothetical protein A3C53_01885 [Omnitrophica WOR_2 bacterium RIFCSPHIGHO2_02_FULL_68_15]|nr:MAG: hypothetical protein A3C53_01885 [Omnitrophica WOR_2 bacterium RIFCSPHIGHO2_02_FULL_68_15]
MSRQTVRAVATATGILLGLALSGCEGGPTYPKAAVAESLQTLLVEDHLDATVRFVDHTLGVQLAYPGALTQTETSITLGPEFQEATRKVLTAIHRVVLSTDADIQFYVLLLSDPKAPGAYLTMVRYLDDVKRANANMIDSPEMFARTIFELSYAGATPVSLDQYVPRDIKLGEFLSWQLARRIQYALAEELKPSGVLSVGRCGGRFQDGEFDFMLDVAPAAGGALDEAALDQVFHVSTGVIAKVLASYRFDRFDAVRLTHPMSGRNLVLPKIRFEVVR